MESRFISVVAFYGPKTGRLRELLTGVQAVIAEQVGGDFRPYTLDQVHATLIALNGVREGGTIVNEYLLEHAGERREMDLPRVMDILARRFATPLRVRIGGFRPEQAIPLYEAFVNAVRLQGIPTATGRFGAMMQVELVNDGPVTILLDSKKLF